MALRSISPTLMTTMYQSEELVEDRRGRLPCIRVYDFVVTLSAANVD